MHLLDAGQICFICESTFVRTEDRLMLNQDAFDKFVREYNEDYRIILKRASTGHYECLITSLLVLRDLREVIVAVHETGGYSYMAEPPHEIRFRDNEAVLVSLGFNPQEINNIHGFLDYVRRLNGKELEECLDSAKELRCYPVAGRA